MQVGVRRTIDDKPVIALIANWQAVSIQQREDLIKQLELNRQLSARDLRYKEQRRSKRADELHAQVI